ncbi:MAG TPA: MFS transporter [Phenylobacterium sp.]
MSDTTGAERLPMRTKLFYGLGSGAESICLYAIAQFAVFYYFQVRGLDPGLAGLAASASLILDGLADPIVGSLSDRTKSRWGRRHIYMFFAPIPIALSFIAVFNAPEGLGQFGLFLWFMASIVALRVSMTFFHTPHLALGGELSQHYTERSKVMAYNSFFGWAGGAATYWVATKLFFPTTAEYKLGLLNPEPYLPYSLTMAVIAMVILYTSGWFTRDRIPLLPKARADLPRWNPFQFFGDIKKALSNRNYVWLTVGYFFLSLMVGLRNGLHIYTNTAYWELNTEDLSNFVIGSFFGFLISFLIAARLHGRFDKKTTMMVSTVAYAFVPAIPLLLGMAGILTPETPGLVPLLILFTVFMWGAVSVMTISVMSALADIADENELRYGVRQEGVLYATRSLFAKIDAAVGTALAGVVLGLIAFPKKAEPGTIPDGVLFNLALWDGVIAMVPGLLAVAFYAKYKIDRLAYEKTRTALAGRPHEDMSPTAIGVLAVEDIGSPLDTPGGVQPAPGR